MYFFGLEEPGFLDDLSEGILANGEFPLSASDLDELILKFLNHFVSGVEGAFLDDSLYGFEGR